MRLLTVIVVDLTPGRSSVFVSSVPDNAPELLAEADAAQHGLRIE